jgi:endonuclease YncB( thermonuclease family)
MGGQAMLVDRRRQSDLFRRGGHFDQPTLWLYGDKDPYYSLRHSRMNFAAFQAAGGKGAFHDYVPPEGLTGHQIASAPELWSDALDAYLADRSLPTRLVPASAQAIDGNTIKMNGTTWRLWGIDAPELDQRCYPDGWPAGIEAARALAAMIEQRPVTCEAKTEDRYGHAVCRVGERDIGAAMVVNGLALASTRSSDGYVQLEARAMQSRAGIHAHACLAPREWREQRSHNN